MRVSAHPRMSGGSDREETAWPTFLSPWYTYVLGSMHDRYRASHGLLSSHCATVLATPGSFPEMSCSSIWRVMASRSPGISSAGISTFRSSSESLDSSDVVDSKRSGRLFDGEASLPKAGSGRDMASSAWRNGFCRIKRSFHKVFVPEVATTSLI